MVAHSCASCSATARRRNCSAALARRCVSSVTGKPTWAWRKNSPDWTGGWSARGRGGRIGRVMAARREMGGGGGDLTRRLDESRADELGDLARGFNRFVGGQRTLIAAVLATSERPRSAVAQGGQVVENTAGRSGQQQEMTDMVATAVHEMGLTVQEIARNASNAAQASQSARNEAQQAREVVGQ